MRGHFLYRDEVWAIIPARGGSKGIPFKNIAPLHGKPLLSYTVSAAREATQIQHVFVSTDDAKIADVAREYGAEIVSRPTEIAGDTASSESALLHALESLGSQRGYLPQSFVFIQCTSPLTLASDLDVGIRKAVESQADSLFAGTEFYHFVWKEEQGSAVEVNHDKTQRLRRQDCPLQVVETGAFYVLKTAPFLERKHRFFGRTLWHLMPAERSIDIDTPLDLEMAEILMRKNSQGVS